MSGSAVVSARSCAVKSLVDIGFFLREGHCRAPLSRTGFRRSRHGQLPSLPATSTPDHLVLLLNSKSSTSGKYLLLSKLLSRERT